MEFLERRMVALQSFIDRYDADMLQDWKKEETWLDSQADSMT